MPVPSSIIALRLTTVGMPYPRVSDDTAAIMGTGPTATTLSGFHCSAASFTRVVTKPLMPIEPSSVATSTGAPSASILSRRMRCSLSRDPRRTLTSFPASTSARTIG